MSLFEHNLVPGQSVRIPLSQLQAYLPDGFTVANFTPSSPDVTVLDDNGELVITLLASATSNLETVTLQYTNGVAVDKQLDVPMNTVDYGVGGFAPSGWNADSVSWQSGTAEVDAQHVLYTPIVDFTGQTSLFIDSVGGEAAIVHKSTVELDVQDANPVTAADLSAFVRKNTRTQIAVNNADLGNGRRVTSASVPAGQGTVEVEDGQIFYTPELDYVGDLPDITYTVSDGQ